MKIKKIMTFLAMSCMTVMLAGCTSGGTQGSGDPGTDNAGSDEAGDTAKDEDGQETPMIRTGQKSLPAM